MKITLKELPLSKKTYNVRQSVKNMRLTYAIQKEFAKDGKEIDSLQNKLTKISDQNELSDEEVREQETITEKILDISMKSVDDALNYVYKILHLSDKEIDKVEDNLEQSDAVSLANTIAITLMGGEVDEDTSDLKSEK